MHGGKREKTRNGNPLLAASEKAAETARCAVASVRLAKYRFTAENKRATKKGTSRPWLNLSRFPTKINPDLCHAIATFCGRGEKKKSIFKPSSDSRCTTYSANRGIVMATGKVG